MDLSTVVGEINAVYSENRNKDKWKNAGFFVMLKQMVLVFTTVL
jgi:hypothetical protein